MIYHTELVMISWKVIISRITLAVCFKIAYNMAQVRIKLKTQSLRNPASNANNKGVWMYFFLSLSLFILNTFQLGPSSQSSYIPRDKLHVADVSHTVSMHVHVSYIQLRTYSKWERGNYSFHPCNLSVSVNHPCSVPSPDLTCHSVKHFEIMH